jgi:hypothetical protein
MKQFEKIQLLVEELEKERKRLVLALEDVNEILNNPKYPDWYKTENEKYKKELILFRDAVIVEIVKNKSLLKNQGFDFGKIFSKSKNDLVGFEHWFKLMTSEVK